MDELIRLSGRELRAAFASGDASPVEVVDALADRISRAEELGAYTTLCLDRARREAAAAERDFRAGRPVGILAGIPLAVKDLFDSAGVRTTYGSPMFAEHVPAVDAEALRRARSAGAILLGKAQTHEFAWGITSVNELMGTSRNPWAPDRISGGSSGGSAVALATHQTVLALGSDTGGSIRVPSAFCGTVGFKPTYGRVSASGVWPLARSLDHPGPMARSPADAALLLRAIAGLDRHDAATEDIPLGDLDRALERGLEGLVVGICPDLHVVSPTPDVQRVFREATRIVERLAGHVRELPFPEAVDLFGVFSVIQRAEALFTHREAGLFPERADEYGSDVRARLERATTEDVHDYLQASAERQRLRAAFAAIFRQVDLLLTPVSAGPPAKIGDDTVVHLDRELEFRELVMSYTVPQDLAGLPACAVRAGFDDHGLPVGIQLTGARWSDATVLGAAQAFHDVTREIQTRWPELDAERATGSGRSEPNGMS